MKDKTQVKKHALEKLVHSDKPPKSTQLKLETRASDRLMEVHEKEFEDLKKLFNNGKMQFQEFTKNVVMKVADLETSTAKVTLAEELFKMQIKFCKSLT